MFLRALSAHLEVGRMRDRTVPVQRSEVKLGMGGEGFVDSGCGAGSDVVQGAWGLLIVMHCIVLPMLSLFCKGPHGASC